jgi:hypothetical protein
MRSRLVATFPAIRPKKASKESTMKMFESALGALALGQKNFSSLWASPSVLIQPAHLIERIGLAIIGGACGLFVAVGSSESSWTALLIMFYGAFAFYIGIDLPSRSARTAAKVSEQWNAGHAVEMFSAVGTFLAAIPTFLSVSLIVIDETLQGGLTILVIGCWAIGSSLQIAAGIIARKYTRPKLRNLIEQP